MIIQKPTVKEFLESEILDYEVDEGYITLLSKKFDDFYAILDSDLFNKEVYDSPRGTLDPTETISIGLYNINTLGEVDLYYRDEFMMRSLP